MAARLEAILSETEPQAPEVAPPASAVAEEPLRRAEAEPHIEPLFADDCSGPPGVPAPAVVVQEDVPVSATEVASEPAAKTAFEGGIDLSPKKRAPTKRPRVGLAMLGGLLFVGGVLFYSAVRWGFSAAGGGSPTLVALGWTAGALGIVCCVSAAYLLLGRLTDRD